MSERQTKAGNHQNLQTCTLSFTHSGHAEQFFCFHYFHLNEAIFRILSITLFLTTFRTKPFSSLLHTDGIIREWLVLTLDFGT